MDNYYLYFIVGYLFKRLLYSLSRSANVSLNDNVKLLYALGYLREQVVEVCSGICLELLFLSLFTTLIRKNM